MAERLPAAASLLYVTIGNLTQFQFADTTAVDEGMVFLLLTAHQEDEASDHG